MEALLLLPLWYQWTLVVLIGLIIGSFLNVFIYRLHTGRSLNGSSHCLSCGKQLRWYELLPLVSYFALRGKCSGCGSYIPIRYVLVEALTAVLFWLVYVTMPVGWVLLLWWTLVALLVVIVVYDLYHLIIPDELTIAITAIVVLLVLSSTPYQQLLPAVQSGVYGSLIAFTLYGGLWKVSGGRWIGFGDAKLSVPLAFMVGLIGTFSFIVLSFWVGALLSVLMLSLQRSLKRGQHHLPFLPVPLTMKSEVPFAPFLVIAFLMVALLHVDVLVLIDAFVTL